MYTELDVANMMKSVEVEFAAHLAKLGETPIAKSEEASDKKEEPKEEGNKEESKEAPKGVESEKPEDKGVKDQSQQDNSKEEKGQPLESKEARVEADGKENAKPSEDPHGQAEDHGYDDEDMAHMHSMYSSMSRGELKAHHDAVRKCMDGHGLAKCEDAMMKSEKDVVIEIPQEVSLLKSELEAVKAESEDRKKNLEAVEAFLKKYVEKSAPAGKAITSLDTIAKHESGLDEKPLQKSEIDAKLLNKAKDPSLSKSDREAINSYYCGSKNIEKVSHLLK